MKKNAKSLRPLAERACEHYAIEICGCVRTRRAIRTKWQSVDFFGADCVGKRKDGSHVYIQVTAGMAAAVTARRRKLEAEVWHPTDTVLLLQLIQTIDPANAKRKKWFFRVHGYDRLTDYHRKWRTDEQAIEIPKEWWKARKEV